jgi:hypothetical protein
MKAPKVLFGNGIEPTPWPTEGDETVELATMRRGEESNNAIEKETGRDAP